MSFLQYVKALFKKKVKKEYDREIHIYNQKKNWLGLTKIYESYYKKYSWCTIKVASHLSEDDYIKDMRNTLTIGIGGYYTKWLLPFSIIKPVLDYSSSYEREGVDVTYNIYKEKEYGIMYGKEDGYIRINWNYVSGMLYNTTRHKNGEKWIDLFWKYCRRTKKELLNLDMTLYKDVTNITDYDENKSIEEKQETLKISFLDYDGESITVTTRVERNTYSYGKGKFTTWIMKYFKKPNVYVSLDLDFDKEIGPRKGSWKGGTMGHSITLLKNELPLDAFKRYCITPDIRGSNNNVASNMIFVDSNICNMKM